MSLRPEVMYERILAGVTPGLEREVFGVLARNINRLVTREQIILAVFGTAVCEGGLSKDPRDRKIRKCISNLRNKDYPIVSSSGESGYMLKADENDIDLAIMEMCKKVESMQDTIGHMRRSKAVARDIRVWVQTVESERATQGRLL